MTLFKNYFRNSNKFVVIRYISIPICGQISFPRMYHIIITNLFTHELINKINFHYVINNNYYVSIKLCLNNYYFLLQKLNH